MIKVECAREKSNIEKVKVDEKNEREALMFVETLIELSIADGKHATNFHGSLPKNVISQLVENGYRVIFHNRFDDYYQISWSDECVAEYVESGSNDTHIGWWEKVYRPLFLN